MTAPVGFGTRILLLVPHPDDEVVAYCAAIGRARAAGASFFAAYLTNGCVATGHVWPWQRQKQRRKITQRHQEARQVAAMLGITPVFWSKRPARHLWRQLPKTLAEILPLIEQHQINQVWVPAYEGGNADHDGLNAIGAHLATMVSVLEFAEYNWLGGRCNSQSFPYPTPDTVYLDLSPAERELKIACLARYRSEQHNLSYVGTERESFRPLIAYDYQQPPHPGLLWYMRFQWVPFHHPGVDRTTHQQISRAILAFQQSLNSAPPAEASSASSGKA